jgi:hypothetical protein
MLPALIGCSSSGADSATERKKAALVGIEKMCRVAPGTLELGEGNQLAIQPSPHEKYDNVECVVRELRKSEFAADMKLGFVGNEMHPREEQK